MNQKRWNLAMFGGLALLVVLSIPFFAVAQDGLFGGFLDGISGSIDFGLDSVISASDDVSFFATGLAGSIDDVGFTALNSYDFMNDPIGTGFGPFDANFQPFSDLPGNPAGADVFAPGPLNTFPATILFSSGSSGSTTPPNTLPPSSNGGSSGPSPDKLKIFIHQIFLNDPFSELPGNQVPLRVAFENKGTKNLDDAKVLVTIPDLAVRATVGPFDLKRGRTMSKTLVLELPEDAKPGTYPVRLQIYSEGAQRIVHREIEIIDYS